MKEKKGNKNKTKKKNSIKNSDLKVSCQVIQAKNLCGTDVFGKSNPYVCVFVMGGVIEKIFFFLTKFSIRFIQERKQKL